jgi:2-methylisocitrate lyase-like PEP mutase family enzyme
VDQGRAITGAVRIPVVGDGDTGYGNPLNVRRTVLGYAQAGFASVMIEDQVAPKRCGHTRGKQVVGREEALLRIRAAVDARDDGADVLILARTDARASDGLDEALWRAEAFAELGADWIFVEAPRSEEEMRRICESVPLPQLANQVEGGETPLLPPSELGEIGFKVVAYPLTLLSASMRAMQEALRALERGATPDNLLDFAELRELVGFPDYDANLARYTDGDRG